MVVHKSNKVSSSGIISVGNNTATRIISIDVPQQCDEIRFQYFGNTSKNVPIYSFDEYYNVNDYNSSTMGFALLNRWVLPLVDGNGVALLSESSFLYSQEIVIRNPSSFGKTIYFSHREIGDNSGVFGVQWQIIGGCNPNGY